MMVWPEPIHPTILSISINSQLFISSKAKYKQAHILYVTDCAGSYGHRQTIRFTATSHGFIINVSLRLILNLLEAAGVVIIIKCSPRAHFFAVVVVVVASSWGLIFVFV